MLFAAAAARRAFVPALRQSVARAPTASRVLVRSYQTTTHGAQASGLSRQQLVTRGLIGATSAAAVFGLCALGQKADENSAAWQDYVSQRVGSTYGYFAGGLGLTATSAYMLFRSPAFLQTVAQHPTAFSIGGLVVCMGSMFATRAMPMDSPMKLATWGVFNVAMGATLAPVCILGGPLVLRAAAYTGGVVGTLSLVAMSARSDQFLAWGTPLAMGLGVVFVTSLGRIFLPVRFFVAHSIMENVVMYGGMAVFSGLVLYDTQKIVQKAKYSRQFDPINESMGIYLDTVNLFQTILMFLNNRRK